MCCDGTLHIDSHSQTDKDPQVPDINCLLVVDFNIARYCVKGTSPIGLKLNSSNQTESTNIEQTESAIHKIRYPSHPPLTVFVSGPGGLKGMLF